MRTAVKLPRPPGNAVIWMALQAAVVFAVSALSPGFELVIRIDSKLYLRRCPRVALAAHLSLYAANGYDWAAPAPPAPVAWVQPRDLSSAHWRCMPCARTSIWMKS